MLALMSMRSARRQAQHPSRQGIWRREDAIVVVLGQATTKHQTLLDAADIGYPHLVQILLVAGWDTEVRSEFGQTPLQIAVDCPPPGSKWAGSKYYKERFEVMKLLIAGGADVNAKVNEKRPKAREDWMARDVAWYMGNKEADKYLKEHGGRRHGSAVKPTGSVRLADNMNASSLLGKKK